MTHLLLPIPPLTMSAAHISADREGAALGDLRPSLKGRRERILAPKLYN